MSETCRVFEKAKALGENLAISRGFVARCSTAQQKLVLRILLAFGFGLSVNLSAFAQSEESSAPSSAFSSDVFSGAEANTEIRLPSAPPGSQAASSAVSSSDAALRSSAQVSLETVASSVSSQAQSSRWAGWGNASEAPLDRLLGLVSGDTASESSGHVQLPPLPKEKLNLLLQAFLHDQLLVVPPQNKEFFESRELRTAWEGNLPQLDAEIQRVILRFKRDPSSKAQFDFKRDPEVFDVVFDIRDRQWLLYHTEGRSSLAKHGLAIDPTPGEQVRMFVEGQGVSGMAILVPRVQTSGQMARAMLVCPRYLYEGGRETGNTKIYLESPYRLYRTLFGVKARVSGKALTAGTLGVATASILTTPNIARSKAPRDESYAIDPEVTLQYVPVATEQLADIDNDGSVVAGIQLGLSLQRTAGFRRDSTLRTILWIEEVDLQANQPWFISRKGSRHPNKVAPGPCYALLLERLLDQRYTKEPLVVPDRLKHHE